jgi:ribosomal protein L37E
VNITRKTGRIVQGVGIMNPEKQAVFCHECGNRSKVGDHYCRNCGTELRHLEVFHQQNGV